MHLRIGQGRKVAPGRLGSFIRHESRRRDDARLSVKADRNLRGRTREPESAVAPMAQGRQVGDLAPGRSHEHCGRTRARHCSLPRRLAKSRGPCRAKGTASQRPRTLSQQTPRNDRMFCLRPSGARSLSLAQTTSRSPAVAGSQPDRLTTFILTQWTFAEGGAPSLEN